LSEQEVLARRFTGDVMDAGDELKVFYAQATNGNAEFVIELQ
jgi:hypothetical protein